MLQYLRHYQEAFAIWQTESRVRLYPDIWTLSHLYNRGLLRSVCFVSVRSLFMPSSHGTTGQRCQEEEPRRRGTALSLHCGVGIGGELWGRDPREDGDAAGREGDALFVSVLRELRQPLWNELRARWRLHAQSKVGIWLFGLHASLSMVMLSLLDPILHTFLSYSLWHMQKVWFY